MAAGGFPSRQVFFHSHKATGAIMNWNFIVLSTVVGFALVSLAVRHFLRPFFVRIFWCLLPLVVAGLAVANAGYRYQLGEGGFRLGVDLVGGTILVYEVDSTKEMPADFKPDEMAASLKKRIDPADLKNVTIRPVSNTRVEIIMPTGGAHQARLEEQAWQDLLDKVQAQWPLPAGQELDVSRGQRDVLIRRVKELHPKEDIKDEDIEKFIDENYQFGKDRKDVTGEDVQHIKELISQVGSLEFRILANEPDDSEAIKAAQEYINDPAHKAELESAAVAGRPPQGPTPPPDNTYITKKGTKAFVVKKDDVPHHYTYSWVEAGKEVRHDYGWDNAAKDSPDPQRRAMWEEAARNRDKASPSPLGRGLMYSRECKDSRLPPEMRREKHFEYFILVRDPEEDPRTGETNAITGAYLTSAAPGHDDRMRLAVNFHFDARGGELFYEVTSLNKPTESPSGKFYRHLAIILDGLIMSAPTLNQPIRENGQIHGNFTKQKVDDLVTIFRAGALPATLKPQPVSENTMGATLGEDTINKGVKAVLWSFAAILIFMIVYYRFAGLVASIALLANLLLTIGFMVVVSAAFTLPGLAGLVLMLGMAVDANVLIYERLREERDRGASLALAIRNGYERAFPTIIDTHLSSIFTAIVLYAVGNDQLKGFGVSLTVGLIISLFTSLYMTRLMFDLWLAQNWLHKLSMFRLFSRPNIDFMAIRYYWFTATILLTIFGTTVFVMRLPEDLNIDFNGGTAYGGQLVEPIALGELRDLLSEKHQEERLKLAGPVQEVAGEEGHYAFRITYRDPSRGETVRTIHLTNPPAGATEAERLAEVETRAQQLPDFSVEQIFPSDQTEAGNKSRYFTVRTSEKAPELVQAVIDRLLVNADGQSLLKKIAMTFDADRDLDKDGKGAVLHFRNPAADKDKKLEAATDAEEVYASPGQVNMLLTREFAKPETRIPQGFYLEGVGKNKESRYQTIHLHFNEPVPADKLKAALASTQQEFAARPQPDRLENFDSQLAKDTQKRAMYAILASWGAILLYLWLRFGNWTFGLAAVVCLIHDLFFTLGIIAFCHYIHLWWPGLASALLLQDFKIDLPSVAALLTLVGYSTNDTIVVFDRIREVRGKNPELTAQTINDSVNQTLSRTLLTSFSIWLVVIVLYVYGGEGVHLFAFVMVVGVIVGTYSSIYIASPLLLIFGEGARPAPGRERQLQTAGAQA
jgi:SecD/SecF fusion protein